MAFMVIFYFAESCNNFRPFLYSEEERLPTRFSGYLMLWFSFSHSVKFHAYKMSNDVEKFIVYVCKPLFEGGQNGINPFIDKRNLHIFSLSRKKVDTYYSR